MRRFKVLEKFKFKFIQFILFNFRKSNRGVQAANSDMTLSRQVDLTQAAQIDRFTLNALTVTELSGIGPDWQGDGCRGRN